MDQTEPPTVYLKPEAASNVAIMACANSIAMQGCLCRAIEGDGRFVLHYRYRAVRNMEEVERKMSEGGGGRYYHIQGCVTDQRTNKSCC